MEAELFPPYFFLLPPKIREPVPLNVFRYPLILICTRMCSKKTTESVLQYSQMLAVKKQNVSKISHCAKRSGCVRKKFILSTSIPDFSGVRIGSEIMVSPPPFAFSATSGKTADLATPGGATERELWNLARWQYQCQTCCHSC